MTVTELMQGVQTVNDAWNKIEKVSPAKGSTFGALMMIWKMLNIINLQEKEKMESEVKSIRETYVDSLAAEKMAVVRQAYNVKLEADKKRFADKVESVKAKKLAEVDKFISATGDPALMDLVRCLSLRSSVSDREWNAITTRITAAHDYQAMKLLADVAGKLNRYYKPPFDADETVEEIETATADLLHMADFIDKPTSSWGYRELMVMGSYDEPTQTQERFNKLDTTAGIATPEENKPLIDRLKEARDIAQSRNNSSLANQISRFIYDHASYIDDRQVIENFYRKEAEALISEANGNDNSKR